ncbi:MAG: hypothetical protein RR322_04185 [Oscillospiraceae bacterium]
MACVEYPLCKRGYYGGDGVPIIMCNGDNLPCAFQRHCTDLKRSIHTSAYTICKGVSRLDEEKEIKNQQVKKNCTSQKTDKFEICPVIYAENTMHINFLDFGITYENKEHIKTPTVKVLYSGKIGNPDFKFSVLENSI